MLLHMQLRDGWHLYIGAQTFPDHGVINLHGCVFSTLDYAMPTFWTATLMILILSSALLGLVGSWIAVARHLYAIEPD